MMSRRRSSRRCPARDIRRSFGRTRSPATPSLGREPAIRRYCFGVSGDAPSVGEGAAFDDDAVDEPF